MTVYETRTTGDMFSVSGFVLHIRIFLQLTRV